MERFFPLAGIALCLFSLWALARHDWLRLTRPSRRVLATVCGHRSANNEGKRNFAAIFRFSADGAEHEVTDALYSPKRTLPAGHVSELVYPEGRPDLARLPRLWLWLAVYGLLIGFIGVLCAKLMGWLVD